MTDSQVDAIIRHLGRIDTALARVEEKQDAAKEKHEAVEEKVDAVLVQATKTNGRVQELELDRALKRGAALQAAATIEDVRMTRAADTARNAWIRPGGVAVLVAVLSYALQHL